MRYLTPALTTLVSTLVLTTAIVIPLSAHEVGMRATVEVQAAGGATAVYTEATLPANSQVTSILIQSYYSTGEPMSDGSISIYAPGSPDVPWRTGVLNREGRYLFTPDLSRRGRWTVRVEAPGHSNFINIVI